jgi:hypothetical protein
MIRHLALLAALALTACSTAKPSHFDMKQDTLPVVGDFTTAEAPGPTDAILEGRKGDAAKCSPGDPPRSCYSGPTATEGKGICKAGTQTCTDGYWSACQGQVLPQDEDCDGKDNNCNGQVDEGLTTKSCYTGPTGTAGKGPCKAGTQSCANGSWSSCQGQVLPAQETCDGVDNDCSGTVDDNVPPKTCYNGPSGTLGKGVCKSGNQPCANGTWGSCQGESLPSAEVCDGLDNDCNGSVDDGISAKSCYTGPAGTQGVGPCKGGSHTCSNGAWGNCTGQVVPAAELCDNVDNDCNGKIDDLAPQTCYTGPSGTLGVGICKAGTKTCSGGAWGSCVGQVLPATEICDTLDNNCNGTVNDGVAAQSCYTGPSGTAGVGICKAGTQVCTASGWGACTGQTLPGTETCDNADNNCNGKVDDGLSQACYTGPSGTLNVGLCKAGTQSCSAGAWGVCTGQTLPATELCDNKDNNCNGQIDEGTITQTCYTGPSGTENVGTCHGGTQTCAGAGQWGTCAGQVVPVAEVCADGIDQDCTGAVDNGCPCSHDKCTSGIALNGAACGTAVTAVCASDSFCCKYGWDSLCISEVRTLGKSLTCAESQGTCAHTVCTTGAALVNGCDASLAACVAKICAADSFCCTTAWDGFCVSEVPTYCTGYTCN